MSRLEIHLFGVGRVNHHGLVEARPLPPSARSLLGYLVLNRQRPHHRDLLANQFWADVDDVCARNRLSTALWRLRRVLEPDGVTAGSYLVATRRGEVRFNDRSDYWLDVADFEQAALRVTAPGTEPSMADLVAFERAAEVFGNDLLEGVDQGWLVLERERLVQLYLAATARSMDRYARLGEVDRAIAAGQRILDRDPLREDTHRALIRLYSRSGQRSAASQQFLRCKELLRTELGVPPLPETFAAAAIIHLDEVPETGPRDARDALAIIESASRTLGIALHELDRIAHSLRGGLPS